MRERGGAGGWGGGGRERRKVWGVRIYYSLYTMHQLSLVFARFSILFLNTKHYTYHWINLYILATMQVSKNIYANTRSEGLQ